MATNGISPSQLASLASVAGERQEPRNRLGEGSIASFVQPGPGRRTRVPVFELEAEDGTWLTDIRLGVPKLEAR